MLNCTLCISAVVSSSSVIYTYIHLHIICVKMLYLYYNIVEHNTYESCLVYNELTSEEQDRSGVKITKN